MTQKMRLIFAFLCLCFLSCSVSAQTHDHIVERAYFEDPSNALTLAQVKQSPFVLYANPFSKGYSHSTFWIRLKIAPLLNAQASPSDLILRMEPGYLDEIELFDPLAPLKTNRMVGDRHAWHDAEYKSQAYNFVIPSASKARYVWLRLKTGSSNFLTVKAFSLDDEEQVDRQYDLITAIFIAIIIMLVVWSLIYWVFNRERLVGIFAIKQVIGLAFMLCFTGYARVLLSDYLSPLVLDFGTSLLVLTTSFTTYWFHYEFFKDYELNRLPNFTLKAVLWMAPLEILLILFDQLTLALNINMAMLGLFSILMVLIVFFGIDWPKIINKPSVLPKSLMIFFHVLFVVIILITSIPSLGLASLSELAPSLVLIHGVVTGLVMVIMLQLRNKRIYEKKTLQAKLTEQEVLSERRKRLEQGHFLEMLTHEFKTSLAVLRMSLGALNPNTKQYVYAEQAIYGMNEVINRCAQVQALSDNQILVEMSEFNLKNLLLEVVNSASEPERIALTGLNDGQLRSDEKLLKIMLANLIDNALKYSKAKTLIEVNVEHLVIDGHASTGIAVTNLPSKVGMPDPKKVFEKYYRAERAHEKIGSGLGLYLVHEFANMLSGGLRYIPDNDRVRFQLWLPR